MTTPDEPDAQDAEVREDPFEGRILTSLITAALMMLGGLGAWAWTHRPRGGPDILTGAPGAQEFQAPAGSGREQEAPADENADPSSLNRDQKARRIFGNM